MINKDIFDGVYKNKKVLVTGDTGFKGSWLCIWLKELGADVYGYSLPPKTDRDNFVKCSLHEHIHHQDGDIRDREAFIKFFTDVNPDIAFHLAAQPLVIDSYKDPHFTFETNLMGTVNFFEAVRCTENIKAAVNVTSDKCYKNNEWMWGYRENEPMGGDDPYSASKGCSELITNSYIKSFFPLGSKCKVASARAGNVIGGGDWAENRIIPDYFRAVEKGESLFLRNPGSTRPWQHVLEPLSGYLLLASKLFLEGDNFIGGWNFGPIDNSSHCVHELIEKMIAIENKGAIKLSDEYAVFHEANLLKLDISKAVNQLQWMPVLNFEETVSFTYDGYGAENDGKCIYDSRVRQIENYISKAKNKNIEWSE